MGVSLIELTQTEAVSDEVYTSTFARDIHEGFSKPEKATPYKYFYDAKGSEIFAHMTDTEEYYLTECDFRILKKYGSKIILDHLLGHTSKADSSQCFNIIELGAGDGRKTKALLDVVSKTNVPCEYIPIDISEQALKDLFQKLQSCFDNTSTTCTALKADYEEGLSFVHKNKQKSKSLLLFLGSTIGNFDHSGALQFLRRIRARMGANDLLLIGFDLQKDPSIILKAYNDPQGLCKEFNINLLSRMNKELGADFDENKFTHAPLYNEKLHAMEMYLVSTQDQMITFKKLFRDSHEVEICLKAQERIFTEYSFKFSEESVHALATASGFSVLENYTDDRNWFLNSLWTAKEQHN